MKLSAFRWSFFEWRHRKLPWWRYYQEVQARNLKLRGERPFGGDDEEWNEVGKYQLEFLKAEGLKPHHRLLDIGCGPLRGGRFFIDYLNKYNYMGTDISPQMRLIAQQIISREPALMEKMPAIRGLFPSERYLHWNPASKIAEPDYILAWSVVTHTPPEEVKRLFQGVSSWLAECGRFYFTFLDAPEMRSKQRKLFWHPKTMLLWWARDAGLAGEEVRSFAHRNGQKMICLEKHL